MLPANIINNKKVYFFTFLLLFQFNSIAQNGDCIQGDCQNGKGVLITDDKTRFEGDFKNGAFIKGKCTYSDSSSFEGRFSNFKANGYCVYSHPAKKIRFTGNIDKGVLHGAGMLVYKINSNDSLIFKGIWTNNSLNGKTIITYRKKGKITYTINCITLEGQPAPGPLTILFSDSRLYSGKIESGNLITGSISKKGIISAQGRGKVFNNVDEVVAFYSETGTGDNTKPGSKKVMTTRTYTDGSAYTGEWKDSLRDGTGTYTWPNGDKYIGQWNKGLREGNGIKYSRDGNILQEGIWRNGIFAEPATLTFYGDEKSIEFDEGKYSGQMSDGKPYGIGSIDLKSGDYYKGEWKGGSMNGWGLYKFLKGVVYEGQFRGIPNGFGIMIFTNGNFYEGEFKDGKQHGKGFHYSAEYGRYDGEWQMGLKHGLGTFVWNNGERYTGEFKNDNIHGQGTKYTKSGKIMQSGSWVNGKFEK